jgi:ligand-binding sensor domain-containing protein/signal transduction histidine kinase
MRPDQMRKSSRVNPLAFLPVGFVDRLESLSYQILLLLLLPLVCSSSALGIDSRKELSQLSHDVWLTENGLPQNTIHSIAQTPDGYIWIGTEEGLARFDGIRFTVFDKQRTPELKSNYIRALLVDKAGALWIGTAEGLARMQGGKFTTFTTNEGLPGNTIQALCEDRQGNIWIGTANGLGLFKDGAIAPFSSKQKWIGGSVQALFEDADNTLWIATAYGLGRLKDDKSFNYTVRDGLASNSVRAIQQASDRRLWFGTLGGLTSFDGERFTSYTTRDGLPNDRIISLHAEHDGGLMIGTAGGLCRFRNKTFSGFNPGDGLSRGTILALLEDREGNLWVGTESGGLSLLQDTKFTTYTTRNGLSNDLVKTIYQDRSGKIWIGTDGGGLNLLQDGKVTVYTTRDGLSSNVVVALSSDAAGNLWAGTPEGLNRFSQGKFISYTAADGLANSDVRSILADRRGNLWIGTRGGLTRMQNGNFKTFTEVDGLPNDLVTTLCEDAQGSIWIGTLGGLAKFTNEEFSSLSSKDGLSSDAVISLFEAADGSLWIGTNGGGLNRLKDGRLTAYSTSNGLLDDVVYRVMEDDLNNLWLSCRKGIFHAGKQELDDFANGKLAAIAPVAYGTADGMMTRECSGGGDPAGWRSRDGSLWFSTIKGVAMIDPQQIRMNLQPPPVVIEQIRVDEQTIVAGVAAGVAPGVKLELRPGNTRLEFYYTAPSFVAPEKVQFKYKLEGFDSDWVDGGNRRIAYYTNLRPGNYTFRVIACNNDGVWNQSGAALGFYLPPYFYQTYWFYALALLALALLGWQLYQFRVRGMKAQFAAVLAERTRIAREIHDNLAQEMAGISVQLEVVARTMPAGAETAKAQLDRVRMLVRHGIAEARRYVWDLRSPALERSDLPTALSETARRLTLETEVEAQVQVSGVFRPLTQLVEDNLLRIGQEAINNAVKHAQPQQIFVSLVFAARHVQLRVRDDGCGFDSRIAGNGATGHFGLVGMRERAAQIGGTLSIDSRTGSGTDIVVDVPIAG